MTEENKEKIEGPKTEIENILEEMKKKEEGKSEEKMESVLSESSQTEPPQAEPKKAAADPKKAATEPREAVAESKDTLSLQNLKSILFTADTLASSVSVEEKNTQETTRTVTIKPVEVKSENQEESSVPAPSSKPPEEEIFTSEAVKKLDELIRRNRAQSQGKSP